MGPTRPTHQSSRTRVKGAGLSAVPPCPRLRPFAVVRLYSAGGRASFGIAVDCNCSLAFNGGL